MSAPLDDAPPPYAAVVFDCDSTLSAIEGVDELAPAGSALRADVEALTNEAMGGGLALEEVYGRRLALLRPDRERVERLGQTYVENLVPGACALAAALRSLGKRLAIVSGGLRPAVLAVAHALDIDADDVHAVDLRFDRDGQYADFDRHSPLARSGGKLEVVAAIAGRVGPLALVGDGVTDLEAAPVAQRFIAFGGVVRRAEVFARARMATEDADLTALLPWLATDAELARLDSGR